MLYKLKVLIIISCCLLPLAAKEAESAKQRTINKSAKFKIIWKNVIWKKNFIVRINNQVLNIKNNNEFKKLTINNKTLDTISIKFIYKNSAKGTFKQIRCYGKFRDGAEYIIRENPCSYFELIAIPINYSNSSSAKFRVKMIDGKNKDRWLDGSSMCEVIKLRNAKFSQYVNNTPSAMCSFAPSYFSVFNNENTSWEGSLKLAASSFIFLHGEKLSIIFNERRKKFFFKIETE